MAVGIVLLLTALALVLRDRWTAARAGRAAEEVLGKLAGEDPRPPGADGAEPTAAVDGNLYIGILSIPRFQLELPVMSQWSDQGLKIAPGRFSGSVREKNLIIAGHNYERHFGNLKNLRAGDAVLFTDMGGKVYAYEVEKVDTLKPAEVKEMVSGGWNLTLFTCTGDGRARVTVRCNLS